MLEFLFCSMLTILPDYLFRRYAQGKRLGKEITLFSVWHELRWGITLCAILTTTLITIVFYYHPSTKYVRSYFRTVTILPETGGRVSEVHVANNQLVQAGDLLFRLDPSSQQAAVETARRKIQEVDAQTEVAKTELAAAVAGVKQAEAAVDVIEDDYLRNKALLDRGSAAVPVAQVERQENELNVRRGALEAAQANQAFAEEKIEIQLPAERASAIASLAQAETELAKTEVYAGVTGRVEQFGLQVGDYVNPILRPAGILVPSTFDGQRFVAGFGQIASSVVKPGMIAEMGCLSEPFTIIPMVVVGIQDVIPSGQIRPTDQLVDPQDNMRPGTLTVYMEPLYPENSLKIPPGSTCLANAYTSMHDVLAEDDLGFWKTLYFHAVDTVALVHAALLRIQVLILPVQTLVFSGH
ncbi:HlyD family secretion protein [Sedimentitalea sp. HM32M-2]|uniref:HlyD family secretion protein n=1 Tax=Sedimentitalea sp. HM32M-2 TaxID=3351566 RepID=UPI003645DDB7